MPEQVNPVTPQQPTAAVATPKNPINWKNILIGIIIGVILIGIVAITFWYFTRPKESETSPVTTTKTSTSSAKTATRSAQKDEIAGWKTFNSEQGGVKFSLKYPNNFTALPENPAQGGDIITNKASVIGNFKNGDILVSIVIWKTATRRKVQYQDSVFAGLKAEKGVGTDQDLGVVTYYITHINSENDFSFECTFLPPTDSNLKQTCETIANTFKFL